MGLKRVLKLIPALILIGAIALVGFSGPYHEAPWVVKPLIGNAKIELGGKRYSAGSKSITAVLSRHDIPLLENFTGLRTADFRGSSCYREIVEWASRHPGTEVLYSVPLSDGSHADSTATELDLSWMTGEDAAATAEALRYLPALESLRLGEIGGERLSLQDLLLIRDAAPQAAFDFHTVIGGESVDSAATSINLTELRHEDSAAMAEVLSCMKNLETVEFGREGQGGGSFLWEDIALLKASRPEARFRYSFRLYGQELDLDTEKLDFRGVKVDDDGAALYSVLPCMNRCSELDMDNTGVSDEAMEKIRDLFPQIKVVWRIWFGENYSVRTDVERILASKPTVGGMIYDAGVLKYCTELKYLDLGHNDELSDLSFAMYMPKLEVLIIAMTGITDLGPLKNCHNLEYLEINSTRIADLSPLQGCVKLRHLNIAGCPNIKDISPLYGISELERLWIGRDTPVPSAQVTTMRSSAPACKINTSTSDPHGEAWRYTRYDPEEPKYYWVPRHEQLRLQLGYNYQEYSFYWLDPLCDMEAPAEFRGKFGKEVYGL